jgi:glycosyltransferase involved in cell wall biosynthesis
MESIKFDIIIPVFRDKRIIRAIKSVRAADRTDSCKLIIVDGDPVERSPLFSSVSSLLNPDDLYIHGPDKGIWDALNKGLDASTSACVGWIGSDDMFSRNFRPDLMLRLLDEYSADALIASTVFFDGKSLQRGFSPPRISYKNGGNIPHYSSFWRRSVIGQQRFDCAIKYAADLKFFYELMVVKGIRHISLPVVTTFMELGGITNQGTLNKIKQNMECFKIYRQFQGFASSTIAVTGKVGSKLLWMNDHVNEDTYTLFNETIKTATCEK